MNIDSLQDQFKPLLANLVRFRTLMFVAIVALLYAFLGWRIDTLQHAQPSPLAITSSSQPAVPRINPATIQKIEQLQNNSQTVRTVFEQARQNPFSE